jgi:phenylacetate-coenzyme A ligase PaaK-like adenylate-forming protein
MQFISDRIITLAALFDDLQHNTQWAETLTPQQAQQINALLDATALEQAVQIRLGNLHALPWIYYPANNEVTELLPLGAVTLRSTSLEGEVRGVLLAWLTGNQVTVVSPFTHFWQQLTARASRLKVFTPFNIRLEAVAKDPATVIVIPAQAALQNVGGRYQVTPAGRTAYALSIDLLDAWSAALIVKVHHAGVSLSEARSQLSVDERRQRLDSRLRFLLYKTRRLPHYQQTPQPQTLDQLHQLPVLTKEALEKESPPYGRGMASDALPSGEVLVSGSSGGKTRYIPYSRDDWQSMIHEAVQTLYDVGLAAGDRVVNTLYGGHMYGGMLTSSQELALMPVESYTVGQNITPQELVNLQKTFGINTVIGIPSLLDTLLTQAKEINPQFSIEKVIYGGALWPEHRKQWLTETLGIKTFHSILAANDGAQIGYQSGALQGVDHYLVDDYNYVEIVDDHGQPVAEGARGHILLTNWQKFEYPLIRYKIGDVGRIHRQVNGERVLEFLGRGDGLIVLNGRKALYYQQVADVLSEEGIGQIQLTISHRGHQETLQVSVEAAHPVDAQALEQKLQAALPSLRPGDGVAIELLDFRVRVVQVQKLARHPVSGKIRLVEDLRFSPSGEVA